MNASEAFQRLSKAQVGYLATVRGDGRPHVVPFVFAVRNGRIVSGVDHKPKRSRDLLRLQNIAANPAVSVLVDHHEEDWNRLWWVRADGRARIVSEGPQFREAVATLQTKYQNYKVNPPDGPVIIIDVDRITGWTAGQ